MLNRRDFLRKSLIAGVGGLLLGDAALEAFERLTHRKVFALGGLPPLQPYRVDVTDAELSEMLRKLYSDIRVEMMPALTPAFQAIRPRSFTVPLAWGGNSLYFDTTIGSV